MLVYTAPLMRFLSDTYREVIAMNEIVKCKAWL